MAQKQQPLFDDAQLPWETDAAEDELVASVVFPAGLEGEYSYTVPEPLRDAVEVGRRVRVPLGRGDRLRIGYCVALSMQAADRRRLKPIGSVIDRFTLVSPAMLELTRWIASHYLCPWGQVLESVVPAGVRQQAGTRQTMLLSVAPDAAVKAASLKLSAKQSEILNILSRHGEPVTQQQLARIARCTTGPITALRKKGLLTTAFERQLVAQTPAKSHAPESHLELNAEQQVALSAILEAMQSSAHHSLLLLGVTGSGKTEVYIQAIAEAISYGRQAIVLVPEISLTPQTVERFQRRFGAVAVLHSHLSDAERHRQWERIAAGRVHVVVGARSAIFAPTPRLGLIVVDEEHEPSFKQDSAPRYHARDVALARAMREQIPLVLGSATPSLESWQQARAGKFKLLRLSRRVLGRSMPTVRTIDLRFEETRRTFRGALSHPLRRAMDEALGSDGQVILFLNRRGFATHIQCPGCGLLWTCPSCELALTHHRTQAIALCHYCNYQIPAPTECPKCHSAGVRFSGRGTQRLEAEVQAMFPNYRALRMDSDSMQAARSYEESLAAFRKGDVRILLGTQMIAKGLDFPNVTLVGVVNADTALHLPDFRATERTFQLLAQVAGRSGRGEKPGQVLIQTLSPDHPAIVAAVRHDFEAFASRELPLREACGYPPFGSLVRLVIRGPIKDSVEAFAQTMAGTLREHLTGEIPPARLLGPAPAPLAKLRNLYRYQIQLQGPQGQPLRDAVAKLNKIESPDQIEWIADVDPISML